MQFLQTYGAEEQHLTTAEKYPNFSLARVISQYKDLYKIVTNRGESLAEVSGKFRYRCKKICQYPAVGDFVMVDNFETGKAVIHHVLPRKSAFSRMPPGEERQTQIVAANIDVVFLCMSLNNDYNLSRLERYLSIAWSCGAAPVIVLTKSDLCTNLPGTIAEISAVAPGTDTVITSIKEEASTRELLDYLEGNKTASFIGSSGVGKSTLINSLAGKELIETAGIRQDDKGRHTTTRRELFVLPQGGIVIDTPGMREIGVDTVHLAKTFSDIDALAKECRFRNCSHTTEPGCAVTAALNDGQLNPRRLESYRKLQKEAQYDGLSFKQIEERKLNTMFKEVGGMKQIRKYSRSIQKQGKCKK